MSIPCCKGLPDAARHVRGCSGSVLGPIEQKAPEYVTVHVRQVKHENCGVNNSHSSQEGLKYVGWRGEQYLLGSTCCSDDAAAMGYISAAAALFPTTLQRKNVAI
jgi:hypothetical protein